MFRLLSFVALAALLMFLICGAASHKTHSHALYLDGLTSPATSSPTALESSPDLSAGLSITTPPRNPRSERFVALSAESTPIPSSVAGTVVLRI